MGSSIDFGGQRERKLNIEGQGKLNLILILISFHGFGSLIITLELSLTEKLKKEILRERERGFGILG